MQKNIFAIRLTKKNFVKHIENLPQHLSEKFIRDTLSIIDITLRNRDLSIIGIAQGFFEVMDYRYCFSTERFIVPMTVYRLVYCGLALNWIGLGLTLYSRGGQAFNTKGQIRKNC